MGVDGGSPYDRNEVEPREERKVPQPKIERYEVIIPTDHLEDDYGNLTVQTKDGQEIKVNKKHENLHGLLIQAEENGRAVKLGYAVYMETEYVHTAELYDGGTAEKGEPPKEQKPPPEPMRAKSSLVDLKNRSFALSYAKDIAVAKINQGAEMSSEKVLAVARIFDNYLNGISPE